MSREFRSVVLIVALITSSSSLLAADDAKPPVQQGRGHEFVCTDYSQGKVFIVDTAGKVTWQYDAKNCNDLWVLPSGNLLFNTGRGVQEVTRADKRVVFNYEGSPVKQLQKQKDGTSKEVTVASEIYACQRLANGNTFVGECNSGRLLEVDPAGKVVKELRLLPEGKDGGHSYIRNARVLDDGHYLVNHYGEGVVREYDAAGRVVWETSAPGGPHSAARLPNGNTLISCGDRPGGRRVFEVDRAGNLVWEVKNGDLPGIELFFMAGFHRLPNGNTVMCNWLGHGKFGKAPHVIEVTPDKKVVWTFSDHDTMRTVSNIVILDASADGPYAEHAH